MSNSQPFQVIDPTTGAEAPAYPFATSSEVDDVLEGALAAQRMWERRPLDERAEALMSVARFHRDHRDELASTAVREMGKPITQALAEIDFSADIYQYYAQNAAAFLADDVIEMEAGTGTAIVRKRSIGVVLGIMPWNFPYYQVARFVAPALMAGNTVLLKPAPQCPDSSALIQRAFAGAPNGIFSRVLASESATAGIIADPRVAGVSFTGSERAGAIIGRLAGGAVKKVVLELGGSDPFLVLDVEDVDTAVSAAVEARLDNNGQSCNGAKRMIVLDRCYDQFVEAFVARLAAIVPGDPTLADTVLGPLSSVRAAEVLEAQVDRAVRAGAKVLLHGGRVGAFHGCGVLAEVTSDNPVHHEELFGPVAVVYRARDEAHAVQLANDTPYGLGSYVFADDANQARRVADTLETGMVYVNGVGMDAVELPFGGVKRSGLGRELGSLGIREFVNHQLVRSAG